MLVARNVAKEKTEGEYIYLLNLTKSNVSLAQFYFGLSMDLLLKSNCHISIFNGLGGHGFKSSSLGQ